MNTETEFYRQLTNGKAINVNGRPMQLAIYNLICTKRDLGLWERGIKIHRNWKVTDVKRYFGFIGTDREKLYTQCCELLDEVQELKKN
jgi:hypothetical protein